jgi:hypothetical protein
MTARSSRLRSATVVVDAAHIAGMSAARARIAASSAADSRAGRCRWWRWCSSPRRPFGERGLPFALELAGHQAVLRLGQLILAPRPVAEEIGAFQPLPPDPVHLGPAGLDLPGGGDRQFQGGRGQRRQELGDNMVVEEPRGHLLAARLAVGVVAALAAVAAGQPLQAALIGHLHALAADRADHQPARQRRALARRAQALGPRPVGGHPRQVALILPGADIGRQRAVDAHQPFPGIQAAHPAGVLMPGQPPARLGCYRGIAELGGLTLAAEVVDWRRFPAARAFMGYTGLVPAEYSSGERTRRGTSPRPAQNRCAPR